VSTIFFIEIYPPRKKNIPGLFERPLVEHSHPQMEFEEAHRRLMGSLTDPALGASAESIAEFRAHFSQPGPALALYRHFADQDFSNFNPEDIVRFPQKFIRHLHKHFPNESTLRHQRGTQVCTYSSNMFRFGHEGRPLDDTRVLSLHDMDQQALHSFAERASESLIPLIYREVHAVFMKAEEKCTKIDLCDLFEWCKCSVFHKSYPTDSNDLAFGAISTPYAQVFVTVHVLKKEGACKVDMLNGDKTVQIRIKGSKPSIIGITLNTKYRCKRCNKPGSDAFKLKKCSKCLVSGIKCFYCSRECQVLDYPAHRQVCTYDWSASDWRENAPALTN
jgi:hypothetical protein